MVRFLLVSLIWASVSAAQTPWDEGLQIQADGRNNPLQIPEDQRSEMIRAGKIHTQIYPVNVTGLLPPLKLAKDLFDKDPSNPVRQFLQGIFQSITKVKSLNQLMAWVGLHPYPAETDTGVYSVPYPNGQRPNYLLGYGQIPYKNTTGFTVSCAACHSSNLFGKTVLGLTNRFPQANHFFKEAQKAVTAFSPEIISRLGHFTAEEKEMLFRLKKNFRAIGVVNPQALGLDTSLAQVSLSLSKRNLDPWASKNPSLERNPRADLLDHQPADSKPAVWWNLKYKNRWLSDGSVISGNPVFTNILWNEIGRGADLKVLDQWVAQNSRAIEELTTAVFSIEPPRLTDFFPADKIQLERAMNGERIFNQSCSRCHGTYEKAWSLPEAPQLSPQDLLRTVHVKYKAKTPVIDVGTDPLRYQGMKALEQLNNLEISKKNGTVIQVQKGYVPPPLVGIWARWPYFHNNSAPSLCAVLTRSSDRPHQYYAGEANDPQTDFDFECNGYPQGNHVPEAWRKTQFLYQSQKKGLSNQGHDEKIFLKNGVEQLTSAEKLDLIQFLQTL